MNGQRDSRSSLSVGFAWASRIMTIALEFAVPVLVGVGLDRWWGTSPGCTISGAVMGFLLFMLHTLRLTKGLPGSSGHALDRAPERASRPDEDSPHHYR